MIHKGQEQTPDLTRLKHTQENNKNRPERFNPPERMTESLKDEKKESTNIVSFLSAALYLSSHFNEWGRLSRTSKGAIEIKNPFTNKSFVMTVVNKNGELLDQASNELRDDKEVVLAAVRNKGSALKFASDKLKKDKEVVIAAICQDSNAVSFSMIDYPILRGIYNKINELRVSSYILRDSSEEYRENEDIAMMTLRSCVLSQQYFSEKLKHNADFMIKAIKEEKFMLEFSPDVLKNDQNFVIRAVTANPDCDEFIPEHLKCDQEFMQKIEKIKNGPVAK